jgi:hypothetical protein
VLPAELQSPDMVFFATTPSTCRHHAEAKALIDELVTAPAKLSTRRGHAAWRISNYGVPCEALKVAKPLKGHFDDDWLLAKNCSVFVRAPPSNKLDWLQRRIESDCEGLHRQRTWRKHIIARY